MISVIIPVFQRENLIGRVIESVLNQSYKDFELIIIDDGSTDCTREVCLDYKKKDSRIEVFSQKNSGSLSARKKGISVATGDYICFIDSDDYIDEDYLEKLYHGAEKSTADIIVSIYDLTYENGNKDTIFHNSKEVLMDSEESLIEMLRRKLFGWELVGKLYKKELIENYCFKDGLAYAEDLVTNWELFHISKGIQYIPYTGYHYYRHGANITNNVVVRRKEYVKSIKILLDSKFDNNNSWERLLNVLEKMVFDTLISWIFSKDEPDKSYYDLIDIFKHIEEEKRNNNYVIEIDYEILNSDVNEIRTKYRNECMKLIDRIRLYIGENGSVYVFGNGIWARRMTRFLQYGDIEISGYVVSDAIKKKEMPEKQLTIEEFNKSEKIIVCVSDKIEKDIKIILERYKLRPFTVVGKERDLLIYAENLLYV